MPTGAAVAAAAVLAAGAGVAAGATEAITTSAVTNTFAKNNFNTDQGELVTLQNTSTGADHNATAAGNGPDGEKLFSSRDVSPGQSAPVNGTQYLTQGKYHFVCTIHPGMESDLTVSGNGTAVPRPDIELKVLSRKLGRVVAGRRLKVRVSAPTESDNVDLVARKGARRLGSKSGLDLAAGASKVVRLRLTGAGKEVLDDLAKAKVKVTGEVPFGAPDTARRTLR